MAAAGVCSSCSEGVGRQHDGPLLALLFFIHRLRDISAANGAEEKILQDPLSHDRISAGMYFSLHEEGERLLEQIDQIAVPLFLAHGNGDYITSFPASRALAETLGDRCCFVAVNCAHHELHQTVQKEELFSRILNWMDKI